MQRPLLRLAHWDGFPALGLLFALLPRHSIKTERVSIHLTGAPVTGAPEPRVADVTKRRIAMKTLVGIFDSHVEVEAALQDLRAKGFSQEHLVLMAPETHAPMPAESGPKAESPGACGANTGQVAGAITGFASGILGAAIVSLALPGVGSILAIGALALGGSFGAVAGGVVGNMVQETYAPTVPLEDIFIYEEALRQGARLLIIQPSDDVWARMARTILNTHGARFTDDAWRQWWQRLSGNEAAAYGTASVTSFAQIEAEYHRGFQAALDGRLRGKSPEEQESLVKDYYGVAAQAPPFQQGVARGHLYYQELLERGDPKRAEAFAQMESQH
jgi:hypothetical protein